MIKASRYIAVLMIIGMFFQINSVFVYCGLFLLNQKAIAEKLCEKKVTDCCGHCFLIKTINADNGTQQATAGKQASTKTPQELLNPMPGILADMQHAPLTATNSRIFTSAPSSFLLDGVFRQIDHPPNA